MVSADEILTSILWKKIIYVVTIVEIRGQNRGWLSAKTGSDCHLVCSVDVKMSEKSQLKIAYFVKGL